MISMKELLVAFYAACDGKSHLSFETFISVLQPCTETLSTVFDANTPSSDDVDDVDYASDPLGDNPKVGEFISILEEYRHKCEQEGNYLEAQRADNQLQVLRKQEFKRQTKALKAKQMAERQDVQIAHNMQFHDFNQAWDQYLEQYDQKANDYMQQMNQKHAVEMGELREKLTHDSAERTPKFSKQLIDWRRRQHRLAQQKKYAEAQKIKQFVDGMEQYERTKLGGDCHTGHSRKEAILRQHHQAELQALCKRIEAKRTEHLNQRAVDSKRLLQRNRNVQTALESKQVVEATKRLHDLKNAFVSKNRFNHTTTKYTIPPEARVVRERKASCTPSLFEKKGFSSSRSFGIAH
uniref:Transmembrane protein putative n=1 Tax=Albugo laibachii Nc14 TaxID=890382 RepID=F0WIL1_9STRA|nr:transmembrane protein putative [Albugo laibachii Nc14]|eukprot:CCA21095.1 transmembrane protein putative [Albugo laibachii Nc14]